MKQFRFGAVRPDWIPQDQFNKTPYLYCDKWCERCGELACRKRGMNQPVLDVVGIHSTAEDFGPKSVKPDEESQRLSESIVRFSIDLKEFCRLVTNATPRDASDMVRNSLDIITYYYLMMPLSVDRALLTRTIERTKPKRYHPQPDSAVTAHIALRELDHVIDALIQIMRRYSKGEVHAAVRKLIKTGKHVSNLIRHHFTED